MGARHGRAGCTLTHREEGERRGQGPPGSEGGERGAGLQYTKRLPQSVAVRHHNCGPFRSSIRCPKHFIIHFYLIDTKCELLSLTILIVFRFHATSTEGIKMV